MGGGRGIPNSHAQSSLERDHPTGANRAIPAGRELHVLKDVTERVLGRGVAAPGRLFRMPAFRQIIFDRCSPLGRNQRGQIPQPVMSSKKLLLAVAVAACGTALAQPALYPLWYVAPVDATTFPDSNNLTRGGSFNPVTGNLLVSTRAGGTGVRILNGATGAAVGTLNMTGVSGGTFALNMIGVASDGAIYGANLTADASSSSSPFRVYRWANETAEPTLVFAGNPGGTGALRFGDSFAVRGSGASTEIIAGQNSGGTTLFHLGTTDGTTFNPTSIAVPGITNGDLRLGLAFGEGDTILAKQGGPLRYISYDVATASATLNASFTLSNVGSSVVAPLAAYSDYVVAYGYTSSATAQSINLYSLSGLATDAGNLPLASLAFGAGNANINAVGAVSFNADGSVVYVVAPNNGVAAFQVVPEPGTWALLGAGTLLLGWSLRRKI
jgi:hypothetical protein